MPDSTFLSLDEIADRAQKIKACMKAAGYESGEENEGIETFFVLVLTLGMYLSIEGLGVRPMTEERWKEHLDGVNLTLKAFPWKYYRALADECVERGLATKVGEQVSMKEFE